MPVRISLASGRPHEVAAKAQLERLLATYDLTRWQFTDAVHIEANVVPHSHPVLTLNTRHLDDDAMALAAYLHEQLHWSVLHLSPNGRAAVHALRARYPEVPAPDSGGAQDAASTYRHLIVCTLEYAALRELLGDPEAEGTIRRMDHYQWMYATVLDDWDWLRTLLREHGLWL